MRKVGLAAIVALAGLSYAWAINQTPLEPYYAAAVRSMSSSWHDLFFGAFDPAGTVTLDKLPGAFWVQAVFVWIFGYHTWSMVLPQVLEGMLAVFFLYRAVSRVVGERAGLLAALILAASPATVALNRGNISDSAMTLLLVLAANAVISAIETGRTRHLIAAGAWVGLAFQTKMIEAWLILPALGGAYLLGATNSRAQKVRRVLIGGVVAAVVSLAWLSVVSLVPTPDRPYVDGSSNDSEWSQVFVYNGFGRFGQQTPLQQLSSQGLGLDLTYSPPPGPGRLFTDDLGRDTGWLLPAALVGAGLGLFGRRRSYYLLWGGWLLILLVSFSFTSTINTYYTAALSPPVAAILAGQAAELLEKRDRRRTAIAAATVGGSVAYAGVLVASAPTGPGAWLGAAVCAVGAAAVLGLISTGHGRAVVAGLLALLVAPFAATVQLVNDQRGAFDTPFESAATAQGIDQLFVKTPHGAAVIAHTLDRYKAGAPYLLAAQTSAIASVFISATGEEALPIGGFTGTIPFPTLAQIKDDVRRGRFHLVLAAPSDDPRLRYIETHCREVGKPVGTLHSYFCFPADA